jgi:hypothetical protein
LLFLTNSTRRTNYDRQKIKINVIFLKENRNFELFFARLHAIFIYNYARN